MRSLFYRKGRPYWVIIAFAWVMVLASLSIPGQQTWAAQSKDTAAEILEGARKEGRLLWYTTSNLEVGRKIISEFHDKYPFIQADVYRTGSQAMLTKVLAETQAKRNLCDVIMTPGGESMILKKAGFYAKYVSPQSKFFPDGFKDPEGYWTDVYMTMNGIEYNTNLVSAQEAPLTWQDLLHPKWKGKIGIDTKPFEWFGYMLKILGQKNGIEYMARLAEQNLRFYANRALMHPLVAAGEISLALAYREDAAMMKDNGAPLDWAGIEPVIPSIHPIGISVHAPHPNAAKLFIDFALSREGQEVWVRLYRTPSRPDVKPLALKRPLKILTPDFDVIGDYQKNSKLFREIVMKK